MGSVQTAAMQQGSAIWATKFRYDRPCAAIGRDVGCCTAARRSCRSFIAQHFRDCNGGSADKADFCISFQVANSLLSSTHLPAAERLSY